MAVLNWVVATFFLAWTTSASVLEPGLLIRQDLALLKRQNITEGSPLFNCHDNCGEAIIEIQTCGTGSICSDSTFLTDYNNCLQCAGTDNEDIWKYYGPELNATAASCGLATTPETGAQDDVGAAVEAGNSTADCAAVSTSTGTSTSSSPSATSSSTSGAEHMQGAPFANYVAVALGALFVLGL